MHNVRMADRLRSRLMNVLTDDPRSADTDLVVVTAFEGEAPDVGARWSASTGGAIERAIASKEFSGKLFETFITPFVDDGARARRLAAIGLGQRSDFRVDRARRVATAMGLTARQKNLKKGK